MIGVTHIEERFRLFACSVALILLMIMSSTLQPLYEGYPQAPCSNDVTPTGRGQFAASEVAILIQSDTDFVTQGWPGNGSSENPYLIERASFLGFNPAIAIRNTRAHFLISDCVISGSGFELGVEFDNVSHGSVEACRFENLSCALAAEESSHTVVRNCTVHSSWDGLIFGRCYFGLIENNLIEGTGGGFGVGIAIADHMDIVNNTLSNESAGVYLLNVSSSSIVNNSIYSNDVGIEIDGASEQNRLYGNTIGPNSDNNALDNGMNNTWDDGVSQGNAWSNYTGVGEYVIPGTAGSIDRYPRAISSITSTVSTPTTSTADQFPWDTSVRLVLTVAAAGLLCVFIVVTTLQRRKALPDGGKS